MYCDVCGHPLNENGFCPICGWGVSTTEKSSVSQEVAFNNAVASVNQPAPTPYNQPSNQVYYQKQAQGYVNQGYANQQQGYHNQGYHNQQQDYNDMGYQDQVQGYANQGYQNQVQGYANQGYQNQAYNQPYQVNQASYGGYKTKSKLPLIIGISLAVIAIIVAIVLIIGRDDIKDYTKDTETTDDIKTTTEEPETTEPPTTEPVVVGEEGTKTIMIYMVGSDLESEHGCASSDIEEMLDAEYDSENIRVVIYTGGAYDWDNSDIPDDGNSIILVEDGDLSVVQEDDAENMGDPDTLAGFLGYVYANYPAEQYSLVLWNHGGGAFFGYGFDETTNDCLTLDELDEAFANSPFNENNKLEWIGFDACLMATIETAHILSPYANYMISSQETEPGWGWDYSFLESIDGLDTGAEIGTQIVDCYINHCEDEFEEYGYSFANVTLSVLDLNKTADVETALNDLFALANDDLSADTYPTYSRIRSKSKEIASEYTGEQSYDVVDLVSLGKNMNALYPEQSSDLDKALNSFVVYNNTNELNANGVSIYFPYNAKEYSSYYIPMYSTFDFAVEYTSFITNFSVLLTGDNTLTAEWDPSTLVPIKNSDYTFSMSLSAEQAANVQNIYYVVSRANVNTPGNYNFVSMSSDVTMDMSNNITANFDGSLIYMQNDTTLEKYELMYVEQEKTDDYERYLLSCILYDEDIQEDEAMYAYFGMEITDATPQGQLLGAYPIANYVNGNGQEAFPERYEINIYDYNYIAFGTFSHEFTSDEDLTNFNEADWADLVLQYNSFPISDGFSTVLGTMYSDVPYYGMFIIEDLQGNRHCSNLVQIQ